jgi:hypothetical protein
MFLGMCATISLRSRVCTKQDPCIIEKAYETFSALPLISSINLNKSTGLQASAPCLFGKNFDPISDKAQSTLQGKVGRTHGLCFLSKRKHQLIMIIFSILICRPAFFVRTIFTKPVWFIDIMQNPGRKECLFPNWGSRFMFLAIPSKPIM